MRRDARRETRGAGFLALVLLLVAAPARAQSTGTLLSVARSQIEDIQPDSAAALLARALDPRQGANASEQARAWMLLGIVELLRNRAVSARQAFHHALERDPAMRVDSLGYLHSDLVRLFAAEREAYRLEAGEGPPTVSVRVAADTILTPNSGTWPIEVTPRRPARVIAAIARTDGRGEVVWADTENVNAVGVVNWDLKARGALVAPGRYTLRVFASDSVWRFGPPTARTMTVSRLPADTLSTPDPPSDSVLPESLGVRRGPVGVLLGGAALGAGALALTSLVGNSALNSGHSDGGSIVIAGAVSLASVIAFVTARREHALPANEVANGQLRERYQHRRLDVAAENARRMAAAPIRIRVSEP